MRTTYRHECRVGANRREPTLSECLASSRPSQMRAKGARDREAARHQRQQCQQHRAKRITTTARAEPWRGDGNGGFTSAIFKGTGRPRLALSCHARRAQQRILQARIAHWIAVQQSSSAQLAMHAFPAGSRPSRIWWMLEQGAQWIARRRSFDGMPAAHTRAGRAVGGCWTTDMMHYSTMRDGHQRLRSVGWAGH